MVIQYEACMKETHCVSYSCIGVFVSRNRSSLVRRYSCLYSGSRMLVNWPRLAWDFLTLRNHY